MPLTNLRIFSNIRIRIKNKKMKKENLKFKNKKEKAFTFIELLAAIIVLAIGVLSVIAVSAKSYAAISLQKNKLIAANLAREGIELVKNVRNENWLYKNSSSYCTPDDGSSACSNGRVGEDNDDCDWRCGSKDKPPSDSSFFRLEQSWSYNSTDYFLQDLDYNLTPSVLSSIPDAPKCEEHGATLKIDSDGFYSHTTSGTDSIFKRLIIINRRADVNGDGNSNNDIQVVSIVCWQERGGVWEEVFVEEHLFNWWKPEQ